MKPSPRAVREACERAWQRPGVVDATRVNRWVDGDLWWIRQRDRTWGGHMLPIQEEDLHEFSTAPLRITTPAGA